jgi:hypothetical protein
LWKKNTFGHWKKKNTFSLSGGVFFSKLFFHFSLRPGTRLGFAAGKNFYF